MADMTAVPFHAATTAGSRVCSFTPLHRGACLRAHDVQDWHENLVYLAATQEQRENSLKG